MVEEEVEDGGKKEVGWNEVASHPSRLGCEDRTGQDHIGCGRKNTRTQYERVLLHQTIELATELAKNGMFYVQLLSDYVLVVSPPSTLSSHASRSSTLCLPR